MRSKYLVTFEGLTGAARKEVAETVKLADAWWHHLGDTWMFVDSDDFDFWHAMLFEVCDRHKARFLLVELGEAPRINGRLSKKAWEWIRSVIR